MRKLILLAALGSLVVPGTAMAAQHRHHGHDRQVMRHDRREVRQDRRELRRDRHELRQDRRQFRREVRRNVRHQRVVYVAPYRHWSYRPVRVGYRLQSPFYGSRYYINDYGMYRVRAPGHWQRWIRYGDDLLLVNVRTGRVLQVVHYNYW